MIALEISYDYYKTFYYVAKYGSFTRAAAELMRGQPNITKTIRNLEEQLGCTLFVRVPRGVKLTPEGEKLYAHVAVAYRHIQDGEREILLDRSLQSGVVKIASSEVALRCFLLPVLERFRKEYPNVRIMLSNDSTPQAIDALKDGLAELAVVSAPYQMPSELSSKELSRVREIPVCGEAFYELSQDTVTLKQLSQYPMVGMEPKTTTHHLMQDFYEKHGLHLEPDIVVATADQLLPLIEHNLGIGFVPEGFLHKERERKVFIIKLDSPLPEQSICLLRKKENQLSIAAKEMERMILEGLHEFA